MSANDQATPSADVPRKPRRRWFQFSLRSFLVLVTILGIWLGFLARGAKRQAEAITAIKAHGGWCYYDFQVRDPFTESFDPYAKSWVPEWLLNRLGEDLFHDVEAVSMVYNSDPGKRPDKSHGTADALRHLDALPDLRALYLPRTKATDEDMRHIGELRELEVLQLFDALRVTDAGASHFGHLTKFRLLKVSEDDGQALARITRWLHHWK